jgi:hypothetical protein
MIMKVEMFIHVNILPLVLSNKKGFRELKLMKSV